MNAKEILAMLVKQIFWILTGVIAITGLTTWHFTSSALRAQTSENKGKIDKGFTTGVSISKQGRPIKSKSKATNTAGVHHPNAEVATQTNKVIDELKKQVLAAWLEQYNGQKVHLVWPTDDGELSKSFESVVKDLRPIESTVPFPTPEASEIPIEFLERYSEFVKQYLPKLAARIGAHWNVGTTTKKSKSDAPAFAAGGATGEATENTNNEVAEKDAPIVSWSGDNQTIIEKKLTVFPGKNNRPTTLQVLYAQEDLWVLRSILDIIKATNGDVDVSYQASIKRIDHIFLGADAGKGKKGGSGGGKAGADPADDRYVDQDYNPLKGAQLRAAFKSTKPSDASLAVAKRIPVRVGVLIDQRKINKLLVECSKAPLTLEVRQVRINRHQARRVFGAAGNNNASAKDSFDTPVEIYGIVYIYNPPAKNHLDVKESPAAPGGGVAGAKPAAAGGAM